MTRLSITPLLSVLLIILMGAPSLLAQQSYGEFERGMNLTDTQRTQVDGIKRKYMDEWRSLNDESARKRLEMREMDPNRPDQREKAEKLHRDLDRIETSRQRLFGRYRGEMSGVLTSEQRGRFNRFTAQENRKAVGPPIRSAPLAPGARYRSYGR